MTFRHLTLCRPEGSRQECLTHEFVEPQSQVLFHRQQAGVVAERQPLAVLLRTGESRSRVPVPAAHTVHPQPRHVPRTLRVSGPRLLFGVHDAPGTALWRAGREARGYGFGESFQVLTKFQFQSNSLINIYPCVFLSLGKRLEKNMKNVNEILSFFLPPAPL